MNEDFVLIYKGSFIYSNRVKNELINNQIIPVIKDSSESARLAGFGIVSEQQISIYVHLDELKKSKMIIKNLRI
jgi:hypothetical protein|tara:strand:- start:1464 stop:1685 length:222 start_codon:yes stop_codon:yes gene_type:complete